MNTLLRPWVRKRKGFGGLSASGEIRRSINIQHIKDSATVHTFVQGQSSRSSAQADKNFIPFFIHGVNMNIRIVKDFVKKGKGLVKSTPLADQIKKML